jgi:CBS domain-containing protein
MRRMKCKDVMTPHPITCPPDATAQAAALIMSEEDVGIVPIVDRMTNRLVGVVTDRDLCLDIVAAGKHPESVRLCTILHADPITCHVEDDLALCLDRMTQAQVRRMPIVDDDGACVGMIAQKDLALQIPGADAVSTLVRAISKPLGKPARLCD